MMIWENCWKNNMEWIKNWCFLCVTWRCYYKWWKSLSPTLEIIENMIFGLNIGLGFRHVWTKSTHPINNNILLLSQLVYAQQLSLKQNTCSVTYKFHSPSFMKKKTFFRKKLSEWEYFLFIHFVLKREKETLSSS